MKEVFEKIKARLEEELKLSYEVVKKAIEGNSSQADLPKGYMSGIRNALFIIDKVEEEYKGGWIPCSERLPDTRNNIVICTSTGYVNVGYYSTDVFKDENSIPYEDVIAWQRLPEPYKGEQA